MSILKIHRRTLLVRLLALLLLTAGYTYSASDQEPSAADFQIPLPQEPIHLVGTVKLEAFDRTPARVRMFERHGSFEVWYFPRTRDQIIYAKNEDVVEFALLSGASRDRDRLWVSIGQNGHYFTRAKFNSLRDRRFPALSPITALLIADEQAKSFPASATIRKAGTGTALETRYRTMYDGADRELTIAVSNGLLSSFADTTPLPSGMGDSFGQSILCSDYSEDGTFVPQTVVYSFHAPYPKKLHAKPIDWFVQTLSTTQITPLDLIVTVDDILREKSVGLIEVERGSAVLAAMDTVRANLKQEEPTWWKDSVTGGSPEKLKDAVGFDGTSKNKRKAREAASAQPRLSTPYVLYILGGGLILLGLGWRVLKR